MILKGTIPGKIMRTNKYLPVRSVIGSILFYGLSIVVAIPFIATVPILIFTRKYDALCVNINLRIQLFILKWACGVNFRIEGSEHIPKGAVLFASQHESSWETLYFNLLLNNPIMYAKGEIFTYPLVGWITRRMGHIPVNSGVSADQMREGLRKGVAALKSGRNLAIFPTGTRTRSRDAHLQSGIGVLYQLAGRPVVPVLLQSGQCWPANRLLKFQGTVRVKFLPPIEPGLDRGVFLAHLSDCLGQNLSNTSD